MGYLMQNLIAKLRHEHGIGQGELASRVGISRQSLHAIESGDQEPRISLALVLASELGVDVEQLFRAKPSGKIRVDDPGDAQGGFRAYCSWVDDKLVYRKAIAAGLGQLSVGADAIVALRNGRYEVEDNFSKSFFFMDGCDPILGVIVGKMNESLRERKVSWFSGSNSSSIAKLQDGLTHCAVVHGNEEDLRNIESSVREHIFLPLGTWELVLAFRADNPKSITSSFDLERDDISIAMRESGSGVRKFTDHLLGKLGVDIQKLSTAPVFEDHYRVAGAVFLGLCDVGVIPMSIAQSMDLGFVPLGIHKSALEFSRSGYEAAVEGGLLDVLFSKATSRDLLSLGGYQLAR